MKIHTLEVKNFKKFAELELGLHPQFTLLVGENGPSPRHLESPRSTY
ncbi:MAG: hypothetical protein IPM54_00135 [Polyangiaceae bacterium]|nr:hypothetical protein [Polyangiaceae bacterium]